MNTTSDYQDSIILTGGGTGGSVTPLLALVPELKSNGLTPIWFGTRSGPEQEWVKVADIPYYSLSAGKWRRYFSIRNIVDPFRIILGFFQALRLLIQLKPKLVMTAGGFVSVPVIWAAWLLGLPIIVHQQDIRPGLANRLMAPFANIITVTFKKSLEDYGKKAILTGNPVRREFKEIIKVQKQPQTKKQILIIGGGTGSQALNELVKKTIGELIKLGRVTHITGQQADADLFALANDQYQPVRFLGSEEIAQVMYQADLVIARAGLGTLTELAYLKKPSILIPMPASHQEDNARYAEEQGATVVMAQTKLTPEFFLKTITQLLTNDEQHQRLSLAISTLIKPEAEKEIIRVIVQTIKTTM